MANKLFTKDVVYEPNIGTGSGIDKILKSQELRSFMVNEVGTEAEAVAREHTHTPGEIGSESLLTVTRWVVNVTNHSSKAMAEEFGQGSMPLAPLGHVLNYFRQHDPNRRQKIINRLLGR